MNKTPFIVMWSILLAGIAMTLFVVNIALNQPWFGFTLTLDQQHVVVDRINKPLVGVQRGQVIQSIAAADGQNRIILTRQDVIEDPDQLETYTQGRQFFVRQHHIASLLRQSHITMQFADGSRMLLNVEPSRPLTSLAAVFWVQMLVGLCSFLIGGWVWGMTPKRYTTLILFIAGCCIMVAAFSAAIYSSRVLALPAPLFELLSNANHTGAVLFSIALVLLFSNYPSARLLPAGLQILFAASAFCWWLCDMFKMVFSGPPVGAFMPMLIGMSLMLLLSWLQYRKARYDPVTQAALRWFALAIALGAGVPVLLMSMPSLLGMQAAMSQGYAFLFFLLIYVGVVQGVARYKLFELEGWVFRILFYLLGAFLLVTLDALLIVVTAIDQTPAFAISLLLVALIYLPLRDMLARRFSRRRSIDREKLFQQVVSLSLSPADNQTVSAWQQLLKNLFNALHVESEQNVSPADMPQVQIKNEGITLCIAAIGYLPQTQLHYAAAGRRLFAASDLALANELYHMLHYALQARDAYDLGASEERSRIARDLHDDIGSRLLSGLYQQDIKQTKHIIRQSIADMRTIISGMTGAGLALETVVNALQQEISQRLQESQMTLQWHTDIEDGLIQLNYQVYKNYSSILRELITNLIKYAEATAVSIQITYKQGKLYTCLADNGAGFNPETVNGTGQQAGNGLANLRQRIILLKGQLEFQAAKAGQGTEVHLMVPLALCNTENV
ncbi:sensor histidine kinase [Alkanindiges illinoisensis]|uniref:sensor histidine kinase n=1 Tax=Alkanindiges illinoisensis TaxID=197183 RepID=UPI00047C7C11|nr:ATP-binding protein [Alkanindiges illinoisensis]